MTYQRSSFALLAVLLLMMLSSARAAVEGNAAPPHHNRLAIVIGNSSYHNDRLPHLANASNDAIVLSETLKRLHFDVVTGTDLSYAGFDELFADAAAKLSKADAVLIFYAGHGVQIQGENYLVPTDANAESIDKLQASSVKLNDIMTKFASRDRQTFIFLDACRNNPVAAAGAQSAGLAQVDIGENSFIAFATQPGNITVDGGGQNSPFTTALVHNIEIPGLSVSDMMIRVRNETEALTVGRQVPWDQSNLREQFYFTEEQTLDPAQLSASLSQILSDPAAKQKLVQELASYDLQTAVLIVGQTLRSVDISGQQVEASPSASGTKVASLSPPSNIADDRQNVVSGLKTLIVGTPDGQGQVDKDNSLARNVQTELRRLGCYRLDVDGDWGSGSVRALTDYYRNRKQPAVSTDPTFELLSDLFLQSGRVCRQAVIVKKNKDPARTKLVSDESTSSGNRSKAQSAKKPRASRAPAAPPPDISGGIGIGGVF
ncbi:MULTISPECIES: caspase family protein [unclassified Mesorhizobium]|uniref:caspase family protein n=1 Tax=unclassified Mesorhizobium TaxID=325217 RepID=UPI000BAF85A0|nr:MULTISPECIES: caspase family protein [unclassified Mesorhizobium]PBB25545.1 peptidase C14 [Mesorhizobium sp. WSM4304]PBB75140.1 peptidase C14 [Mesorhizobium sp. WSM4308]